MREVEVLGTYEITRIGRMIATIEPDPPWEHGEHVMVGMQEYVIKGIERHPVANGPWPGLRCGLHLEPEPVVVEIDLAPPDPVR